MKKNILVVFVLIGVLFALGAYSQQDGRYKLVFGKASQEFFTFKAKIPKSTQERQQCFKIDSETGKVWIFKDEIHQESNEQATIRQYFEELPVEKTVTTRMLP